MSDKTQLATIQPQQGRLEKQAPFSFAPTNFTEAIQLAERLAQSELVPKNFRSKPQDILVAMQMGAEVGLSIMQSLKSIAVINGMPSLYGDGFLAVIMGHPAFEWIKEDNLEDIARDKKATCTIKRRGAEPHSVTFTEEMAAKAGLLTKDGPWRNYKPRQMQMRARGFCGRDTFADALRGIVLADEAYDMSPIDVTPEQPKIQASVNVTKVSEKADPPAAEQPAAAAQDAPAEPAPEAEQTKVATITIEQAKNYYREYQKAGKLPEESKAFLKKMFGFEDSRLIPEDAYDYCMEQARLGFPAMVVEENLDAEPV